MKSFIISLLVLSLSFMSFAQNKKDEQEILKLNHQYEQAHLKKDVAFFERVLDEDYIISYETGTKENKKEYLQVIQSEKANPTYKLLSMKSEDAKVRLIGNTAVLTGTWLATTVALQNDAEPVHSKGLFTSVFEKRNGRWFIVAEHMSKAPRDRKWIEQQVLKVGREYNELMKRLKSGKPYEELVKSGDIAALDRLLADEYIYTSRDGVASGKKESFEEYKNNKISSYSADILEQEVRVISDNAAVETGRVHYKGVNDGKAFDLVKRYTTTWVWRDGWWQIVADHTSKIEIP